MTRQELYEAVWTTPISHLSTKLGVSGYRLIRACDECEIPRPGNDYWSFRRLKVEVERTPLPPPPQGFVEPIVIRPVEKRSKPETQQLKAPASESDTASKDDQPVVAANTLKLAADFRKAHPLVRSARNILERGDTRESGIIYPDYQADCLAVLTSKPMLRRALLIMDALINELERRGYKTMGPDGDKQGTYVMVGVDRVRIMLSEGVERRKRELTAEELKFRFGRQEFTEHPNGRLTFRIDEYEPRGGRKSWSDGKFQRLDDFLIEIVETIVATGEAVRLARLEREEWHRQWEEQERLHRLAQQRREEEQRRVEDLCHQSTNWHKAEEIERFVEACRLSLVGGKGQESTERWLAWAAGQAERINPLRNGWLDKATQLPVV